MKKDDFISGVEKLVNPITVGSLHFIQSFSKLLPKDAQKNLIKSSAKKIPFMGFVVEPYAFFLCYEIDDEAKAASLLPDGFRLLKTSIFAGDEPKYYGIFGCFRSHTSAFWGTRAECYIIAEDEKTGLLSWIIVDYDTDTISYDSQNGLKSPNCTQALHATDYTGVIHVDINRDDKSRHLAFTSKLDGAKNKALDQRLWLEGNLSIGYGRILSRNSADIFSLRFEPGEVIQALDVPLDDFSLKCNSWYPGLFKSKPSKLVCFPYAQHFISDSPGSASMLKNRQELLKSIDNINFDKVKTMSAKSFTRMFMLSSTISFVIIIVLVVLLIIK